MAAHSHSPPYDSGYLQVSNIHKLHYEQYGRRDGKPVLFLHGGPGGSTSTANTAFFDPTIYRVILFDQRGCGNSTPTAELEGNETSNLISDIEILRKHLDISKWHLVFGGSWGSTLGLLYAQAHPDRVSSLILRGIFLVRKSELAWGVPRRGTDAALIYPDAFDELMNHFTEEEQQGDWLYTVYKQLKSEDKPTRVKAARVMNTWDFKRGGLLFDPSSLEELDNEDWSLAHATLVTHYLMNGAFIREGQILEEEEMDKIRHIPSIIVQGRYDMVCPPQAAWDLHKAWPQSRLIMVPDAGHSSTEPGTFKKLVQACDEFGKLNL